MLFPPLIATYSLFISIFMHTETSLIETDRLLLKPASIDDAAFLLVLSNTPKWIQYIGDRNIKSLEDATRYLKEKVIPPYEKLGFGTFIVTRKSDNCKIGTCGLYDREGLEGIDLGFALLPSFEKKGYAFEASQKVIELGFGQFNLRAINAITRKDNDASQRLLEKLGFLHSGIISLNYEELILYILNQ